MSKFDDFFAAVLDGARTVGGDSARDFLKQVTTDSEAFKLQAESDLQRWTVELANGQIEREDFESLLRGQLAEAALAALLKAGVAAQKAGELRDQVIKIAIGAAFRILL
jgi:hypothetical protein